MKNLRKSKKLLKLLSLFFIGTMLFQSCAKDNLVNGLRNTELSKQESDVLEMLKTESEDLKASENNDALKKAKSTFYKAGSQSSELSSLYNGISIYIESFEDEITDNSVYCPIEFARSGVKVYDQDTKAINRIVEYCENNGVSADASVLMNMKTQFENANLEGMINAGDISRFEVELLGLYNSIATNTNDLNTLLAVTSSFRNTVKASLFIDSEVRQRLLNIFETITGTVIQAIDNGGTTVDDVPQLSQGAKCGIAIVAYGAAFVGLALATGGATAIVGIISFGTGIFGVFDNC